MRSDIRIYCVSMGEGGGDKKTQLYGFQNSNPDVAMSDNRPKSELLSWYLWLVGL